MTQALTVRNHVERRAMRSRRKPRRDHRDEDDVAIEEVENVYV